MKKENQGRIRSQKVREGENFSIEVETPFLKKYSRIEKSHYENKIMWVGLKAD